VVCFTPQAYVETYQRGTETAKVVCAVQDGAEWLQGVVDTLRPDAVRILVSPHAIEHLTAAAQPVLGTATPELIAWLDQQAHTLKHATDGARQVLSAVAGLPIHRALDPTAVTEPRDRSVAYFTKRLPQVQYAAFQAGGYPIGAAALKARIRSWSRRDSRAAACTGRALTSIQWWHCAPWRAPTARLRSGRESARDFEPWLSSGVAPASGPLSDADADTGRSRPTEGRCIARTLPTRGALVYAAWRVSEPSYSRWMFGRSHTYRLIWPLSLTSTRRPIGS